MALPCVCVTARREAAALSMPLKDCPHLDSWKPQDAPQSQGPYCPAEKEREGDLPHEYGAFHWQRQTNSIVTQDDRGKVSILWPRATDHKALLLMQTAANSVSRHYPRRWIDAAINKPLSALKISSESALNGRLAKVLRPTVNRAKVNSVRRLVTMALSDTGSPFRVWESRPLWAVTTTNNG